MELILVPGYQGIKEDMACNAVQIVLASSNKIDDSVFREITTR